ncbi:MAG: hypothetical protein QOK19_2564, partial [Solirubrobacteraceae bacterium]|nr:hypothetical protein [Solirubrobacteraceae bacterium]
FSGQASETTTVTVAIFKGTSPTGTPVASATAAGTGGSWTSVPASPALTGGVYTATASQKSSIGNGEGISEARTFEVSTKAPTVTLNQPVTPSNNTAPTFTGTASEASQVTVHVLAGAEVASYTASVLAGKWSIGPVSPALEAGRHDYKVYATETSAIGNEAGRSEERSMTVDTTSPVVSLSAVATPSNNRTPSFSGEASDSTPVVVHVLLAGKEVASAEATPAGKKWKTAPLTPAQELGSGEHAYTAYATQASSLGNTAGSSAEVAFVVNTNAPVVTIAPVPTPTNNRTPAFNGTASDTGEVKIRISGGGKKYETSAPVSGGAWSTAALTLPAVKSVYTAVASQPSSIGNPTGESTPITFIVDPSAPSISLTPPKPQINTATPSFSGTAGDTTPVTVAVCRASASCGAEAGEWAAKSIGGGAWTATLTTPLEDGDYQAIASERSLAGDLGATGRASFTIDTHAPAVALTSPAEGATLTGGSLLVKGNAGTAAHDVPTVTVQLFAGSGIASGQTPVQNISVPAASGNWSATLGGIVPGAYTVRALQSDEAGNQGISGAPMFTEIRPASAAAHGPAAAFGYYPVKPHVGETISLVSGSTDDLSPITGYSWNLRGTAFVPGAQTQTISFATPGGHTVQLSVTDAGGRRSVASQVIPVSYPLMRPFPLVRIAGTRSRGRVKLKVLSVQAPAGATVTVTCTGKGCPAKSQVRVVPTLKSKAAAVPVLVFPRFQRSLPPGVALVVRVTHAGQMGKYTRFAVRRGKLPVRADACVNATELKSVPCTS